MTLRHRVGDWAGLSLMLFAGFNLNGVVLLLTGRQGVVSPAVLTAALILCLGCYRLRALTPVHVGFLGFIISYIWLGLAAASPTNPVELKYVTIYAGTLLFVSGLYFWLSAQSEEELDGTLRRLKLILLVTCVFAACSGYLAPFFRYVAPAERASGLFENPNEAAVAALDCLVLIAAYPARRGLVTLAQAGLAGSALLLTFSKSGMLMGCLLGAAIIAQRRSIVRLVVALGVAGFGYWALSLAVQNDLLGLTGEARERVADLLNIFGGELDARTTTGRTELWQLAIGRIAQTFPLGAGLGTFHAMEGGYRNSLNEWLGAHDTFLMILGEAGLVPLLAFAAFIVLLLRDGLRSRRRFVVGGFALVMLGDMIGTHGALGFRLSNLCLAVMMALAGRGSRLASAEAGLAWRDPPRLTPG